MKRKEMLEKRLARLIAKKDELGKRALASEDANEVRSINEQIADINDDIADTKEEMAVIETEEKEAEERAAIPTQVEKVNSELVARSSSEQVTNMTQVRGDVLGSMEYRQAFKKFVQTGTAIPESLSARSVASENVSTTQDLGAIIPSTILNEFIKKLDGVYGQLYAKVRKLNIKGGVKIPISDLSASFKWITESTVSPTQSAGEIKDFIEFSYNIGEIRVAETLLASIVTLDMFESEIVDIMLKAYVKEMDRCIIHGSGNGQMLGILNDPRVTGQAGHTIQMSAADFADWTKWRKNFFSKLPLAKRSGEFIFPVSTVESYLLSMADSNNNPIFRQATGTNVADGGDGADFDRFFGRAVTLVEPDIIGDFDTASVGDVVGIFWTPTDYAINSQMQFGMKRYFDEEKNQYINKALTIVDGKMVDVQGCYLIVKK